MPEVGVVDRVRRPVHDRVLPDNGRGDNRHEQLGMARVPSPADDHGRDDRNHHQNGPDLVQRHPVVEAEQVVENLKRRGLPVEYILFPDEGHGWRKMTDRVRSTVALVEFFSKYLKGE